MMTATTAAMMELTDIDPPKSWGVAPESREKKAKLTRGPLASFPTQIYS